MSRRKRKHRTHVIRPGDQIVIVDESGGHLHIGPASRIVIDTRQQMFSDWSCSGQRFVVPYNLQFRVTIETEKYL